MSTAAQVVWDQQPQSPQAPQVKWDNPETKGLRKPGNIPLNGRPIVPNADGTYSSEKSFSIGTDQGEVLLPLVVNGQELSQEDAINHYRKTGEHMGIFDTPDNADAYATATHNRNLKTSSGAPNYEAQAAINAPVAPIPLPASKSDRRYAAATGQPASPLAQPAPLGPYGSGQNSKSGIEDISDAYKSGGVPSAIHTGVRDASEALSPLLTPAAAAAPVATALGLGASAVAQPVGKSVGEAAGLSPEWSDVAGDASSLGAGVGGFKLGENLPEVGESIGRALRVQPTADNSPTTGTIGKPKTVASLKPAVKAVANIGKLVGGPELVNALVPEHPEPVGPFRRVASGAMPEPLGPADAALLRSTPKGPNRTPAWKNAAPSTGSVVSSPVEAAPFEETMAAAREERAARIAARQKPYTPESKPVSLGVQSSGVGVYPEPREPLPEDRPGVMYSVKRGTVLPESAERGAPGAVDVLKNIGKPSVLIPRGGVGYPEPREITRFQDAPVELGPQPQEPQSTPPNSAGVQPAISETPREKREPSTPQRDLGAERVGPHKSAPSDKTPKPREPREQLQNFDADTLDQAKQELAAAHEAWSSFERPGQFIVDTNNLDEKSIGPHKPDNYAYGIKSSRPKIEQSHPWVKNLPKLTQGKLQSAIESGKGVEYTRLLNEAGKHIQTIKEANAPVIEEMGAELDDAAKAADASDPQLAQTLRDIRAGKYNSMRRLSDWAKEKLNDADTTTPFDKALEELSQGDLSESDSQPATLGPQSRETTTGPQELGPQDPNQLNKKRSR